MPEEMTAAGLHPLLASRWSPTVFDASHQASAEDVELLIEAARWAPSAGNSQPWSFVVGRRGDETHRRLVAHMTVQARALGLHVRQFRAFDRDGLASEFALPGHWEVTSMSAIGRVPADWADTGLASPRERRPVDDLLWPANE